MSIMVRAARRRALERSLFSAAFAALLLASAVAAPRHAHAQDAQTQAMGRALFNEGVTLFNKGDYEAACPKFEASLKHYPGLGTRGKLAECYEKLGRLASAWHTYREVAQLAMKSGDPAREQVATERAKALEPKLSYVTVVVPPASDVPGLVVKRSGKELERSKLGAAEAVDAGTVVFEISAPGRKPFATQLSVAPGQSAKLEVPQLETSAPTITPRPVPPPPPPEESPPPPELVPVEGDPPQWQKPAGVVAMAAGVVGMGIGGGFGLAASSTYDEAFEGGGGCNRADNTCDAAGQSRVDDARSQATMSTILFVAGGVVAATGVVLYLTAPSPKRTGVHVAPAPLVGGGGFVLGGVL